MKGLKEVSLVLKDSQAKGIVMCLVQFATNASNLLQNVMIQARDSIKEESLFKAIEHLTNSLRECVSLKGETLPQDLTKRLGDAIKGVRGELVGLNEDTNKTFDALIKAIESLMDTKRKSKKVRPSQADLSQRLLDRPLLEANVFQSRWELEKAHQKLEAIISS